MPALLEPPPTRAPIFRTPPLGDSFSKRGNRGWKEKLSHSGFLVGAVLLHLLVFLIVATWVVFQAPRQTVDDPTLFRLPPREPSIVHPAPSLAKLPSFSSATVAPATPLIVTQGIQPSTFRPSLPSLGNSPGMDPFLRSHAGITTPSRNDSFERRAPKIKKFIKEHRPPGNIASDPDNDPHKYKGAFPVFVASYADGDWNCNLVLKDGKIVAGSLPDLITKINEWSHTNIKGTVMGTPLAIGGPDLMDKKPPFIFFTGHKDFVLTDAEIHNLQDYLNNGGAIWGDNALPGAGSRFDVAFHREMKRVVPDKDKLFEDVPPDHDIFIKSWFDIHKLPQGMNFYSEPLQHLDIDGKVAIVYTPNDYSDLFFMDILSGDTAMAQTWVLPGGSPLFTNGSFLGNSNLFFRNFNLPTSLESQRLGMNIVGFLLVRFDKDLALIP